MNPGIGDLLGGWHANGALPVLAAVGLAYAMGVLRARAWPGWRAAAFVAGLALLALALSSGIETWADRRLSVHMVQHLLLTFACAPLLVVGAPIRLALAATSRSTGRAISRLASGPLGVLVHPVVAGVVFALATLLLHVPAVYDSAADSDWVHVLVHAGFFTTALVFWTPLLAPEPIAHRLTAVGKLLYLILAMPAMAVVGVVLNAGDPVYNAYPDVVDQQLAGALMWIGGGTVIGAAFLLCGWQALLAEERRAVAREARGGSA
jgi:putative membrane protein